MSWYEGGGRGGEIFLREYIIYNNIKEYFLFEHNKIHL